MSPEQTAAAEETDLQESGEHPELEGVVLDEGEEEPENVNAQPDTDGDDSQAKSESETSEKEPEEPVDKKISRLTFKRHEERRKRKDVEARLAETEKKLAKLQETPAEDVVVPPMPDAFDADYAAKLAARDAAIRKQAEISAQQNLVKEAQEKQIQQQAEKAQEELQTMVTSMYETGDKHGIEKEDLQKADQRVAVFIKDAGLARYIIGHADSALIVKYLSESATELEDLARMDPMEAAGHIASKIAPIAAKLKPGITKTPEPLEIPGIKGAPRKESEFLKGVSFE